MKLVLVYGCIGFLLFLCCFKKQNNPKQSDFMNRDFTGILKGIAIFCVVLSHVGSVNNLRVVAPLGGMGVAIFLICSGYGLTESGLGSSLIEKNKMGFSKNNRGVITI